MAIQDHSSRFGSWLWQPQNNWVKHTVQCDCGTVAEATAMLY
jgi:hypothetical protein